MATRFFRASPPARVSGTRPAICALNTSLLDQLTASQMQLVGFHLPGGLGHVEKSGDSYKYVEDAT